MTARDNDEDKAFDMWKNWFEWRMTYHPDKISIESIERQLKKNKAFIQGYDKEGRPCLIIKGARHIPEECDVEEMMRYMVYVLERACEKADEYYSLI
jgi:hypothetical protein